MAVGVASPALIGGAQPRQGERRRGQAPPPTLPSPGDEKLEGEEAILAVANDQGHAFHEPPTPSSASTNMRNKHQAMLQYMSWPSSTASTPP